MCRRNPFYPFKHDFIVEDNVSDFLTVCLFFSVSIIPLLSEVDWTRSGMVWLASKTAYTNKIFQSQVHKWRAIRTMSSVTSSKSGEQLYKKEVNFTTSRGDSIQLTAVYQDTAPIGSSVGTVVSLHGAPGSHLDFKYITPLLEKRGIRHIGVNYPGFDVTDAHPKLQCNNFERHSYVNSLLDKLNIDGKVVFMGHSRGGESALMLAAERKTAGLVLITPFGLRIHRGIRPYWFLQTLTRLYQLPGAKSILNPLYFRLYQYIGLKASSGEIAANCLRTVENSGLTELEPHIEKLNQLNTKVLFLYAGKDWLIEPDVSAECSAAFEDMQNFEIEQLTDGKDEAICEDITKELKLHKGVSVFFKNDGHFLQKARANVIVRGIDAILGIEQTRSAKL